MTKHTADLVAETRWLLSFRTHPLDVAEAVHRSPATLYNMALKHNLPDIQKAFAPYEHPNRATATDQGKWNR